jgi:hypothetical protein
MKKWLVGYWIYKNDQWEDYEIIIEANSFNDAYEIFKDKKRLGKLRFIQEYYETSPSNFKQKLAITRVALEAGLMFIIPDQLRKIIEQALLDVKD